MVARAVSQVWKENAAWALQTGEVATLETEAQSHSLTDLLLPRRSGPLRRGCRHLVPPANLSLDQCEGYRTVSAHRTLIDLDALCSSWRRSALLSQQLPLNVLWNGTWGN